ncbi:SRPBCC family protein [Caballeronia grimmiae]|uniref:SRPBCC family protein n=1 Tax=Caballeronia grimmiae TaxID=1071679 RepID=UPI0038BCF596
MSTRVRAIRVVLASGVVIASALFVPLPRGALPDTRIVSVAAIRRPPSAVLVFFTTPAHWPAWHPSSLSVQGKIDHPLEVGEHVVEEFIVAGRRGRVVWTVSVKTYPVTWSIDGVVDGRAAGTVTYMLTPEANGTRFVRGFTYGVPSLWFALVNSMLRRDTIQSESDEAVNRLKRLLENIVPP